MEMRNYKQELHAAEVDIKDVKEVCGQVIAIIEFDCADIILGQRSYLGRRTSVVFVYDSEHDSFEFDVSLVYEKVYNWVKENAVRVIGGSES